MTVGAGTEDRVGERRGKGQRELQRISEESRKERGSAQLIQREKNK
jgi:hypothetical protein